MIRLALWKVSDKSALSLLKAVAKTNAKAVTMLNQFVLFPVHSATKACKHVIVSVNKINVWIQNKR